MNSNKQEPGIVKSTFIYGIAFAIAGLTPFILLPVLTRELSTEEFGIIASFLIFVILIGNFSGLGASGYLPVRFFKDEPDKFGINVWTSILSVAALHLLALPILWLIVLLGFETGLTIELLVLSVVIALANVFNIIFLSIAQSASRPFTYLKIRFIQSFIEIVLFFIFQYYFFEDHNARIFSYALAVLTAAAAGFIFCRVSGYVTYKFGLNELRGLVGFGLPLMPHIIAGTAVLFAERTIILSLLGTKELGIYMSAMQVGMAMLIVIEPVNKAFAPWLFKRLGESEEHVRRKIVQATYVFFVLLILGGVVLNILIFYFFELIVGPEFYEAKSITSYIVFGFVFQGMYYAVTNYVFYVGNTGALSITTCIVSVFGAILTAYFISTYGLNGAGIGFLCTNALLFLSVWHLSARSVSMPWGLRRAENG